MCTRRTLSRIKTYCRRGSQSYVKWPVVSVDGGIVTSLTVARPEQKSSFSVASSQISSAFPISAYLLQRCSAASHSANPIDGLSDNLSVTLMGLVLSFHYCLFGVGLGLKFSLVGFEIVRNALKKRGNVILPSSLWERSLLSSSLLRERTTPPFSLYKRRENQTLRGFYDLVMGLKKVVFISTSLQFSTYRSFGDWLLIVYDLAVDGVLFTASDNDLNSSPGYPANLAKFISQDAVIRANNSSLLNLTHWCLPVTAVCAQEPSTSSFQERILSPQSLFIRGDSHLVFKMWIINDAGTSTPHSTTASLVASPLIAETLAMQNAMISAHSCGLNSLSLEALVKKLPVFIYNSNRLTYPFIALVFFNVTSEFHSLSLSSRFVIFS